MGIREEITSLVDAMGGVGGDAGIRLRDEECAQLEGILLAHPEIWPVALADTFQLLQRRLRWEDIDRHAIPASLIDFFDDKVMRDMDPMALARAIGREIHSSCEDCSCRC